MNKPWFTPSHVRNLLLAGVSIFLLWYFLEMVVLVAIAMLVAIVGSPVVNLLNKISLGKFKIPEGFSVSFTLLVFVGGFAGLFFILVPLFMEQVNSIASINFPGLFAHYQTEIIWIEINLRKIGIMANDATLATFIKEKAMAMVDYSQVSKIGSGLLTFTGTFFFNLFSVLFISWFLLYDLSAIHKFIIKMMPKDYKSDTEGFLTQSQSLISRYLLGIILDTLAIMISYAIVLSLLGVKGAIVIAVLAGFLNVIPYIGPVIGVISGIMIGLTSCISAGVFVGLDIIAIKIGLGMLGVIILDNIFYDPFIQGKSIQAHPLEIFLVIMAGEIMGGVAAMIVIIPVYGVMKILVTRYLHHFPQIQKIENRIEEK
ncbi:MAG: AI-2E family transporter [Bacteroidales bacterium]